MSNKKCSTCRREFPIEDYVGEKQQTTTTCKLCREKYKKPKCAAKDRNNNPCRANAIPDKNFCKNHEYMCEYTDEMLVCVELCSGCKKMYFLDGYKICKKCRERSEENRESARDKVVLCAHEGCTYKRTEENDFCGHHQLQQFVKETIESGKKVCFNHIRGCRQQLDITYKYSKCSECLKVDREKDKNKRHAVNNILENTNTTNKKICTTCCNEKDLNEFIGKKQQDTKTCKKCREQNKKADLFRDKTHRNIIAFESEKKPERRFAIYKKSAQSRNLDFDLSLITYIDISSKPCYYCGIIQDIGFNGIDRVDSLRGYFVDNCVSCCKMCNYLKNNLLYDVFLKRVKHILVYNKLIDDILYPEVFQDYINISFNGYKNSAKERNLEFKINKEEFTNIISKDCYICGKINTETHKNGIDRFDNNIGYFIDNCRPCCRNCNFMKQEYNYNDLLNKLLCIYHNKK